MRSFDHRKLALLESKRFGQKLSRLLEVSVTLTNLSNSLLAGLDLPLYLLHLLCLIFEMSLGCFDLCLKLSCFGRIFLSLASRLRLSAFKSFDRVLEIRRLGQDVKQYRPLGG